MKWHKKPQHLCVRSNIVSIFDNLDLYEVDKVDYDSFFYRLPKNEIMKTTPREGLIAYKDMKEDNEYLCGVLSEQVMGMSANRYFIFNFMDESRLGPHKLYKHITMTEEEYTEFLKQLQQIAKDRKEDA